MYEIIYQSKLMSCATAKTASAGAPASELSKLLSCCMLVIDISGDSCDNYTS
jgi:hypothetical protein